jgi:hypothetical protein
MIIKNAKFINIGEYESECNELPNISENKPEFTYYGWVYAKYYTNKKILQNIFIRSSINSLITKKGYQISLGIRNVNNFTLTFTDKSGKIINFSPTGNTLMQHGTPVWYHFAIVATTSEITNKTKIKFYINGQIETFTEKNIKITNMTEIDKLPIDNSDILFLSGNINNHTGITLAGFNFENRALSKKEINNIIQKTYKYTINPDNSYSLTNNNYCIDNYKGVPDTKNAFTLSKCNSESEQLYKIKNSSNNKITIKNPLNSESCITTKDNILYYDNCNGEHEQQFDINYNLKNKSLMLNNNNKCFDFSNNKKILKLQNCESENKSQQIYLTPEKYINIELIGDPSMFNSTTFLKELPFITNNKYSYYGWVKLDKHHNSNRYIINRVSGSINTPLIFIRARTYEISTYLTYKAKGDPELIVNHADTTHKKPSVPGWIHYALSVNNNEGVIYINGISKTFKYVRKHRKSYYEPLIPINPNGNDLIIGNNIEELELAYWHTTNYTLSKKTILNHMEKTKALLT